MLKIIRDNAPSLRQKSTKVEAPYNQEDINLILEMHEYIKNSQLEENDIRSGVGLAAPQVGVNKRMLVVYYETEDGIISHALINPRVTATAIRQCYLASGEGCLSVEDEHEGYVYRANKITIEAYDAIKKQDVTIIARGYEAIVLQHELDHLDGILFYDRISKSAPFKIIENSVEI